ncbi:MAG: TonB-dependent receptor [Vicinamibacterales bacterium]
MSRRVVLMLAFVLSIATTGWSQTSTGNIYGTVADEQGGVLPGATVTITATDIGGAPRTTVTDEQGRFRFLNLDRANYKLNVSLQGFGTVEREVVVNVGRNIDVPFTLKVATVQETLTVTAETPLVDTKRVGTALTLTREELTQIPNGRDPWVVLQSVPGVVVDRVNIAGNESGQQSSFVGKGAQAADSMWTLDGVTITDTTSGGATSTYFDYDAFDEVAVSTGGTDLSVQTGGIGLNFVTKRGTNQFKGSVRGFFTDDKFQGSNLPNELKNDPRLELADGSFSDKADHIDNITDWGFDVGGPILKDKLWFWGSYGKNEPKIIRLNQTTDRTVLKNADAKINWQASGKDNVSFFWFNGAKEKYGRQPGQTSNEPDSFLWNQGNFYPDDGALAPLHGLFKWEDNHVFSNNMFLNAKYAYYGWGYGFSPRGGSDQPGGVDGFLDQSFGSWFGFTAKKPWHIVDVSANYFKSTGGGNHDFKFGFGYRRNPNKTTTTWSGSQVVGFHPAEDTRYAWVTRQRNVEFVGENTSFFASDTFTKDRLTLSGGIRFDRQQSKNLASTAQANPTFPEILPTLSYDGSGPSIDWKNLVPRVGMTYALDNNHKTLVRASYATYAGQLNPFEVTSVNPVGGYYTFVAYNWVDLNGDHFAQKNEVLTNLGPVYANNVDPAHPTAASSVNLLDPNYKANRDHEFIAGLDREVAPNLSVSAAYTWRRSNDLPTWNPRIGMTSADYTALPRVTINGYTAQAYAPNAAALANSGGGRILTNRPDFHTGYSGLELQATKRLSNKWMGRFGFAWNDSKEFFDGAGSVQQPTRSDTTGAPAGQFSGPQVDGGQVAPRSYGAKRNVFFNAKWTVNANGLYQLPGGFDIAGNLVGRQGYPQPIILNLSAGGDGTVRALAVPELDTNRYKALWNLDFRLAKRVRFKGNAGIDITADIFNALNTASVLERNRNPESSQFQKINELISPRVLRLGFRLVF